MVICKQRDSVLPCFGASVNNGSTATQKHLSTFQSGQATTEYILMLAIMTLIGVWIMNTVSGAKSKGKEGSANVMARTTTKKIANDEHR